MIEGLVVLCSASSNFCLGGRNPGLALLLKLDSTLMLEFGTECDFLLWCSRELRLLGFLAVCVLALLTHHSSAGTQSLPKLLCLHVQPKRLSGPACTNGGNLTMLCCHESTQKTHAWFEVSKVPWANE